MTVKTPYYSYRNKQLCKGCKLCVKGRKLVLFVTGLCSRNCFYCPLSERKYKKDVICANEWEIEKPTDILYEAKMCGSTGAGITGGDPLLKLGRTIGYIGLLKKRFGKKFHIHLYTSLLLVNEKNMKSLCDAGLDEIRFHPDFISKDYKRFWSNIKYAKKYRWKIGVEIPIIPGYEKQTVELIEYFKKHVDFFNFNELEIAGVNIPKMKKRNYRSKDGISYAVKGSQELALKLMKKYPKLRIHYCTARLKDAVQLANRMKNRAKNAKTKYDKVTNEGMLIRGAVYLPDLKPGFGYHNLLRQIRKGENKNRKHNKQKLLQDLAELKAAIKNEFKIDTVIDKDKFRLITSTANARKLARKLENVAIVEEYPTKDSLEIELQFL
ncbi:radical SAM protein [Candidatus Woesearchaeota archaeon]|nr:radical SAM protein [Candidatus Woesearchaeota archaeon]